MATRKTASTKTASSTRKKATTSKKAAPTKRTAPQPAAAKTKSTKTPAKRSSAAAADALSLLIADHAQVKKMYKQYQKLADQQAPASERETLAMNICRALTLHAQVEESIFYPAARAAVKEQDLLDHADVEHASAKELIQQITSMQPDESHYDAKVCVLCEYVAHHVQEEEEELFPKIRKAKLDLAGLGQQIQQEKERLSESDDPVGTIASAEGLNGHRTQSGKAPREQQALAN
jgi:hemerythrin superfamily protein